jgi:hypothetical protein
VNHGIQGIAVNAERSESRSDLVAAVDLNVCKSEFTEFNSARVEIVDRSELNSDFVAKVDLNEFKSDLTAVNSDAVDRSEFSSD